CQQHDSHPLTF
nr:immunoglobulin light chain junction region [Macaca mulatta]MOW53767.1 immunoglobulin light chain junction region [Macaca mulatta]MOW55892.1 immunoglobulin light chain junction region [Macaca mulatta]